jgi:uncharacterized protein (DUF1015 family)
VPDLSAVIAPPYDVISPAECEALYAQHPQNVVKLILGKEGLANHEKTNFYQTAASLYREWLRQGVLKADPKPALYVVDQTFEALGKRHTRRGFMARVLLEEFGKGSIHPHEQTISAPKADRLRLMRAAHANFSPIFGLYPDPNAAVRSLLAEAVKRERPLAARDREGIEVSMWKLDDAGLCATVTELLHHQPIFIADGHHRYETALNYRNEARGGDLSRLGDKACDWIMMTCVAMEDPGLVILPTHRVVRKGADVKGADVLKKLERHFSTGTPASDRSRGSCVDSVLQWMREGTEKHRFAMYSGETNTCVGLELGPDADLARAMPGRSPAWRRLDVSLLHYLVIADALGVPFETLGATKELEYFKDAERAAKAVQDVAGAFAFFVNATPIAALQAVAGAREKMPPKSTYFYPKLVTGLVINPVE